MNNINVIVIFLVLMVTLAITLIILSFYVSVMTRTFKGVGARFSVSISSMVNAGASRNKFLFKDQINIERQLSFSLLRFKGKTITFRNFTRLSVLLGVVGIAITYLMTSRFANINIPALVIGAIVGFIVPRWYLVIIDGRLKRKVSAEVPQALAKISDFARFHANIERAVIEATNELPKATKKYFQQAWEWRRVGNYQTFPEMMYDLGRKSKSPAWLEFAHMCLVDSTIGSSDKIAKLRTLQSRSRKLFMASKIERKALNAKLLKMILAYIFLVAIWFFETFFAPSLGVYLYTTAIGRLLMMSVYITFTFNTALFTWLYYDN